MEEEEDEGIIWSAIIVGSDTMKFIAVVKGIFYYINSMITTEYIYAQKVQKGETKITRITNLGTRLTGIDIHQ